MDRFAPAIDPALAPVVPHRVALLLLAAGGFAAFAAWQASGVALFLESLGAACL